MRNLIDFLDEGNVVPNIHQNTDKNKYIEIKTETRNNHNGEINYFVLSGKFEFYRPINSKNCKKNHNSVYKSIQKDMKENLEIEIAQIKTKKNVFDVRPQNSIFIGEIGATCTLGVYDCMYFSLLKFKKIHIL